MQTKSIIRKTISPIIYTSLSLPITPLFILIISITEQRYGFLFNQGGMIETLLFVLFIGSPILWYGSKLINMIEKQHTPSKADHFRQTCLHYLAIIYVGILLLTRGYQGGLAEALMFVLGLIALWGIIMNALYLLRMHRTQTE
jgi:hypothetical protein